MLVGTGNDIDGPGFLQSFDPETGKLQWKFYTVPIRKATRGWRPGRASTPRGTAAPSPGSRARTIPRRISTCSAREIRRPPIPWAAARGAALALEDRQRDQSAADLDAGRPSGYLFAATGDTRWAFLSGLTIVDLKT